MDNTAPKVTVEQLIGLLQALPGIAQTMPVDVEGCDCVNPATYPFVNGSRVLISADIGVPVVPIADVEAQKVANRNCYLKKIGL